MPHLGKSRPNPGLGFQVQVCQPFKLFPLRSEAVVDVMGTLSCQNQQQAYTMGLSVTINEAYQLTVEPLISKPSWTLVFKAHRLLYHSTLGLRVIKKNKSATCPRQVKVGNRIF